METFLLAFQFAINTFLLILVPVAAAQYRKVSTRTSATTTNRLCAHSGAGRETGRHHRQLRSLPEVEGAELTYALLLRSLPGEQHLPAGRRPRTFNIADEYGPRGLFRPDGLPPDRRRLKLQRDRCANPLWTRWSNSLIGPTERSARQSSSRSTPIAGTTYSRSAGLRGLLHPQRGRSRRPPERTVLLEPTTTEGRFDWSQNMETVVVNCVRSTAPIQAVEAVFREFGLIVRY